MTGAAYRASVSYAAGFAVAVVAPAAAAEAVGVDAESDAAGPPGEYAGVLGPERVASAREWTRVEAALKADGRGLRVDPAAVRIRARPAAPGAASPPASTWTATVPDGGAFEGWDAAGPPGLVVSVALRAVPPAAGEEDPAGRAHPATP
ncbi:hypothetical protein [Microbacterium hominis]|uniref:Uncharacterized protein n=1 Tax=Microbacterium hominis TaxID=162426 RepID=A0A7D4TQ25_9MICO|nr:hypothetical protein [Microbacterium hominis]QKJ18804.1 hypothetical protein HQM25_05010 [Microbacterium hominis]